ncbi:MAG: hypothetical protein R8M70_01180 [Alphaproteobacteria bacterium]|nr:hypothetical protein [Alphaproteobacteria bacterium]
MKKILGIGVLLVICAFVAVFVARKSDYAYVKDFVADDCSNAFMISKEDGEKIVMCVVAVKNPSSRLVKIASKEPNSVLGVPDLISPKDVDAGFVFVSFIPDYALKGVEAEHGCNYKLVYLPDDKDYTYIADENNDDVKSVMLCQKD